MLLYLLIDFYTCFSLIYLPKQAFFAAAPDALSRVRDRNPYC